MAPEILYPILIGAGVGFISWFLRWQMDRNQAHLDLKLKDILDRIGEMRQDVTGLREHNNDSHAQLWKEMRSNGERIASIEAVQKNCHSCRGDR